LLEHVTFILCFLHALLKIRDRTTKAWGEIGQAVHKRVWEAYHAPSKRAFSQRLRRLKAWAEQALPEGTMRSHTLDLGDKRAQVIQSYDHLYAHRTSNLVDRLMTFLDQACFHGQYFHGTCESAESRVRARYQRAGLGTSLAGWHTRRHDGEGRKARHSRAGKVVTETQASN
jgi:hypothetical protein